MNERLKRIADRRRSRQAEAQPEAAPRLRAVREPTPEETEAEQWRRVVAMRRGVMGLRVFDPTPVDRDQEAAVRANEQKTYLRRLNPWR